MFISSGESLVLRLSRLMSTFDETVAVMPYRSSRAVSKYDMWLEPTNEKSTVKSYVGGACLTRERVRIFLRHRAATPQDISTAEKILADYSSRLTAVLAPTEIYSAESGKAFHRGTDDSVWEFYVETDILRYEPAFDGDVSFYVSFEGEAPVPVGAGCTKFKFITHGETYSRRYFDEEFYRSDTVCVRHSIAFEFEASLSRCALRPILGGAGRMTVYKVLRSGEAERVELIVAEKEESEDICTGVLISDGKLIPGEFDFETGGFTPYKVKEEVEL